MKAQSCSSTTARSQWPGAFMTSSMMIRPTTSLMSARSTTVYIDFLNSVNRLLADFGERNLVGLELATPTKFDPDNPLPNSRGRLMGSPLQKGETLMQGKTS